MNEKEQSSVVSREKPEKQKQETQNTLTLVHEFPASRFTDKETYKAEEKDLQEPVSYTHLTLPTSDLV